MTRGDEMLGTIGQAMTQLGQLRLAHYEDADVRNVVVDVGARTERFFKTAVWPGLDAQTSFDTAINRLKSQGIAKTRRDEIHALRELYNDAKHDPNRPIRLKTASDVIGRARDALTILIATGIGMTTALVATAVSRLLWVSGYDVYTAGCTEVYVSLPLHEDEFATHLDIVWIAWKAWDPLKADLLATGSFFYGSDHFDPKVYARFNESDFIGAGVWDGDYRQLVATLAKHEDRGVNDSVIADLRRDHMYIAVLSSIALAGVDVAIAANSPRTAEALTAEIVARADQTYAMPSERLWVAATATALGTMITQVPFEAWRHLTGPYWNLWAPKKLVAHIQSPSPKNAPYVIDDANRIVIV